MRRQLFIILSFFLALFSCEQGQNTGSGRSSGYAVTKNFSSFDNGEDGENKSEDQNSSDDENISSNNKDGKSGDQYSNFEDEESIPNLYTRNEKEEDPIGVNIGKTVYSDNPKFVGGEADCSVHVNRQPGDPCGYDFCGDASSNEHLSAETYKTIEAIMDELRSSNEINTCLNEEVISILENISSLNLSSKELSDIRPLGFMKNLVTLNLEDNSIKDLYPLQEMLKLQTLKITNNDVDYLDALASLTSLKEIYAAHNNLTRVTGLTNLSSLEYLNIAHNNVSSIIPLASQDLQINVAGNDGILLEAKEPPPEDIPQGNCANILGDTADGDLKPSCYLGEAYLMFNPTVDSRSQ